jgi:uncharacterized short protein YbdD (DUF466 family)
MEGAPRSAFPPFRLSALSRLHSALKQITGMPDYSRYLAHMAERHPDRGPMSEREFFEQYVNARYGDGASRCC